LQFFGCADTYPPLDTVTQVDLQKYMGKWYEIASFPNSFQKGCNCTTAEYELMDGYVKVVNTCRKDSVTGKADQATGKAWVVEGSNNAKLRVSFFWPFKGDYWIIDLAPDYSYVAVGNPGRKYLWILSRTPRIDGKTYAEIVARIEKKGFDISKLKRTEQNCSNN
jgi:apolipoprotein D and lipocalin family protein